jgi:hypothetical protein
MSVILLLVTFDKLIPYIWQISHFCAAKSAGGGTESGGCLGWVFCVFELKLVLGLLKAAKRYPGRPLLWNFAGVHYWGRLGWRGWLGWIGILSVRHRVGFIIFSFFNYKHKKCEKKIGGGGGSGGGSWAMCGVSHITRVNGQVVNPVKISP